MLTFLARPWFISVWIHSILSIFVYIMLYLTHIRRGMPIKYMLLLMLDLNSKKLSKIGQKLVLAVFKSSGQLPVFSYSIIRLQNTYIPNQI